MCEVSNKVTTVDLDRICEVFQFICSVPRLVILFSLHFSEMCMSFIMALVFKLRLPTFYTWKPERHFVFVKCTEKVYYITDTW